MTPLFGFNNCRGEEIQLWLDNYQAKSSFMIDEVVDQFVILDDDEDMNHLKNHLIQTDYQVGLDWRKVLDVLDYFNGKE